MRLVRATVIVVTLTVSLLSIVPSASTASTRYGPPGDQFSIRFPSMPRKSVNDPRIVSPMPAAARVYAYWVSSNPELAEAAIEGATLPPTPSFLVLEIILTTKAEADSQMSLLASVLKTRVKLGRLYGYERLGPESKINQGVKITDPHATEGAAAVQERQTIFIIEAFTSTRLAASAFVRSFTAY